MNDIGENTTVVIVVIGLLVALFSISLLIKDCNVQEDRNLGEVKCLRAGGDPYECCDRFQEYRCRQPEPQKIDSGPITAEQEPLE